MNRLCSTHESAVVQTLLFAVNNENGNDVRDQLPRGRYHLHEKVGMKSMRVIIDTNELKLEFDALNGKPNDG